MSAEVALAMREPIERGRNRNDSERELMELGKESLVTFQPSP